MQAKWRSSEAALVELRVQQWWEGTGLPLTTTLGCMGKDMWRAESSPFCQADPPSMHWQKQDPFSNPHKWIVVVLSRDSGRGTSSPFQGIMLAMSSATQPPLVPVLQPSCKSYGLPSILFKVSLLLKFAGVSFCCLHICCLSSRALTTCPFLPAYPTLLCHVRATGKGQT